MKRTIFTLAMGVLMSGTMLAQSYIVHKADNTTDEYKLADVEELRFSPGTAPLATPEAIDLGLSVKWGSFNLGATEPEGSGWYIQWGMTEPDPTGMYTLENYFLNHVDVPQLKAMGVIGEDGNLTPEYDACTVNLGPDWRLPTDDEVRELLSECEWECFFTEADRPCWRIIGPSGEEMIIPLWGQMQDGVLTFCWDVNPVDGIASKEMYDGNYFSSTPYLDADAQGFRCYWQSGRTYYNHATMMSRSCGFKMRPVYDPK